MEEGEGTYMYPASQIWLLLSSLELQDQIWTWLPVVVTPLVRSRHLLLDHLMLV